MGVSNNEFFHTFLNLLLLATSQQVWYMYVCLICTIVHKSNDVDEDTGSSNSNVTIGNAAAAAAGIIIAMVIVATMVIIILLYCYCCSRRSKGM